MGALRGRVHPIEIARALSRQMQAERRIGVGRVYVPNAFEVFLNPVDYATLCPIAPEMEAEIVEILGRQAAQREYAVSGPMRVRLSERASVREGGLEVEARFERGLGDVVSPTIEISPVLLDDAASKTDETSCLTSPDAKIARTQQNWPQARAVLLGNGGFVQGRVIGLDCDAVVVGRAPHCGVHVPDAQVSKAHARLDWNGSTYVLTSEGRNGTHVNGELAAEPVALHHGDEIRFGASSFHYRLQPTVTVEPPL